MRAFYRLLIPSLLCAGFVLGCSTSKDEPANPEELKTDVKAGGGRILKPDFSGDDVKGKKGAKGR